MQPSLGGMFAPGTISGTPGTAGLFGSASSMAPSTTAFTPSMTAKPSLFGTAAPTLGAPGMPFGSTTSQSTAAGPLFGQSMSAAPPLGTNLFYGISQQPSGSLSTTAPPLFGGQLQSFPSSSQSKPSFSFPTFSAATPGSNIAGTGPTNLFFPGTISSSMPPSATGPALQATIDSKPYGSHPLFQTLTTSAATATPLSETKLHATAIPPAVIEETKKSTPIVQYRVAPRSATKIRPRGVAPSPTPKLELFNGLYQRDGEEMPFGPEAFVPRRQNIKKLQIDEEKQSRESTPYRGTRSWHDAEFSTQDLGSPRLMTPLKEDRSRELVSVEPQPAKIKLFLTDATYYTLPPIEELNTKSDEELKQIPNFTIGKERVGSLQFLEPVDLTNVDLCSVILFDDKEVTVYPDEATKAPVGLGLNRSAIVKLHHCWPIDKATRRPILDSNSERLQKHVEKLRHIPNTEFIDYVAHDGTWVFKVQHFSRYALDDDDDSDNEDRGVKVGRLVTTELDIHPHIDETPQPPSKTPFAAELPSQTLGLENDEEQASIELNSMPWASDVIDSSAITYSNEGLQVRSPRLQEHLGLAAKRLQAMKASLFADDSLREPFKPTVPLIATSPDQLSEANVNVINEEDFMETSMNMPSPSSLPTSRSYFQKALLRYPLLSSIASNKTAQLVDAGLHLGRTFRAGWGPCHQLITCPSVDSSFIPVGMISIRKFSVADERSVNLLRAEAVHHDIHLSGDRIPRAVRKPSPFASVLNDAVVPGLDKEVQYLLRLGSTLWDEIAELHPLPSNKLRIDGLTSEGMFHLQNLHRKNGLVAILEEVISKATRTNGDRGNEIFMLLASGNVHEACKKAIIQMKPRLACLISQAAGDTEMREDIAHQLRSWKESNCLDYVSKELVRIYRLLSGQVEELEINLTWQQAFLACLLFATNVDSSIIMGFNRYADCVFRGTLPAPVASQDMQKKTEDQFDLFYHMVKLYASRSHLLEVALHPQTFDPHNQSFYMTWVMSSILLSLNIRDFIKERTREMLHVSFAAELESMGCWQWAAFVLLHLSDDRW